MSKADRASGFPVLLLTFVNIAASEMFVRRRMRRRRYRLPAARFGFDSTAIPNTGASRRCGGRSRAQSRLCRADSREQVPPDDASAVPLEDPRDTHLRSWREVIDVTDLGDNRRRLA